MVNFQESLVKLNVSAKGWEDAIRQGGQLLLEQGYIEPSYIDRMINSVHEFGPYIVLFPGFALGHCSSGSDVLKTGISFITLETPVVFGHEDHDPVSMVACLSTINADEHMEMLMAVAEILSEPESFEKLLSVKDVGEFISIIKGE